MDSRFPPGNVMTNQLGSPLVEESSWQYFKDKTWLHVIVGLSAVFGVLIAICVCVYCRRRCRRYDYSAIDEEVSLLKKWDNEKKAQINAERGTMMLSCQFYLRNTGHYTISSHLADIGSRLGRSWFLVSDQVSSDSKDKLLTMTATSKDLSPFTSPSSKRTVRDLLSTVRQHPYLFPVYVLDAIPDQEFVVVIQPFQSSGSLKDYIYNSKSQDSWEIKYKRKGKGLHIDLIRSYGRQILEALSFLQDLGFPVNTHVHSGNVFIVNKSCRLSGYENVLAGHQSRLSPIIRRCIRDNAEAAEVVCFGHLLFEMAAGFELDTSEPESRHLNSCGNFPEVVECLNFIFSNGAAEFPSLHELKRHKLFQGIQVETTQVKLSSSAKAFLKQVRKDALQPSRTTRKKARKKSDNSTMAEQPQSHSSKSRKSKQKEIMKTFPPKPSLPIVTPPPPPPPPSAVPPPPPPAMSKIPPVATAGSSGRSALLQAIRKGATLKKAVTVDKSAPRV